MNGKKYYFFTLQLFGLHDHLTKWCPASINCWDKHFLLDHFSFCLCYKTPKRKQLSYYFLNGPKGMAVSLKYSMVAHLGSSGAGWYLTTALIHDCDNYCIIPPSSYWNLIFLDYSNVFSFYLKTF